MTILARHCTFYQWEADFVGPIRQAEQPKYSGIWRRLRSVTEILFDGGQTIRFRGYEHGTVFIGGACRSLAKWA